MRDWMKWAWVGTLMVVGLMGVGCYSAVKPRNENAIPRIVTRVPLITSFPEPTDGPAPTVQWVPTLATPLTREQAIQVAWELDKTFSRWDEEWTPETALNDQNRIKVEWHSDVNYAEPNESPMYDDYPVWSVTIKGTVFITSLGWSGKFSGVTYDIYVKSGEIAAVRPVDPKLE